MKKIKFIPIIGTISSGKSTFLQGLLGTDVFATGSMTTTKFVCLIKNSKQTKFYHVIPKRKKDKIELEKIGNETLGEDNIREEIKKINESLVNKEYSEENIFYLLEIPIKTIKNELLLEECYFMDIPGLNDYEQSYINIIFSVLSLDDIKLEIIIFDSTSIGSETFGKLLNKLEVKKCLKKEGNLIVLNKIDLGNQKSEKDKIIDFYEYFYSNFEDDKNEEKISINLCKNKLIPMNSLLFIAEAKMFEDFYSFLKVEYFSYFEIKKNNELITFIEYIRKKKEFIIKCKNKTLNLDEKLTDKEKKNN